MDMLFFSFKYHRLLCNLKRELSTLVLGAALFLNAPCLVDWCSLGVKSTKQADTQRRGRHFFYMLARLLHRAQGYSQVELRFICAKTVLQTD